MFVISEAEEFVMSVLWSADHDLDLKEISERVLQKYAREWKLQTTATFMTRLQKKGFVNQYRIGRYSHYSVLISRDEYRTGKLKDICKLLFDDDIKAMQEYISKL